MTVARGTECFCPQVNTSGDYSVVTVAPKPRSEKEKDYQNCTHRGGLPPDLSRDGDLDMECHSVLVTPRVTLLEVRNFNRASKKTHPTNQPP